MKTLEQFVNENNVKMTFKSADSNPNMSDMPRGSRHFKVTLRSTVDGSKRQMTVPFSMGPALLEDPDLASVLNCLASDASLVEQCADYVEFVEEMGYEVHQVRQAEKTFKACVQQTNKLRNLLGDAFEDLLYNVEHA